MLSANQKIFLLFLTVLIYLSYFLGFYFNENSIGSGGYKGDLVWMWLNFDIFKNNNLVEAINHKDFFGNRTPLLYVINTLFNPLINDIDNYRLSIFILSLSSPIILYLCLKEKYKKINKEILLLISSIILLSPYYRTSSIWGLEIVYGIITMLISIYYIIKLDNNKKACFFDILILTFFSSLTVYFDQKLLFVPIFALIRIFLIKNNISNKINAILLYGIFALPFVYLIIKWNGIVPPATVLANPEAANNLEQFNLDFYNIGYATTIMALYLLPLLVFIFNFSMFKFFVFIKFNIWKILFFFLTYIFLFIYFDWYQLAQSKLPSYNNATYGLGFINKFSFILFEDITYRKIFLIFSFLFSWTVVYSFFNGKITNTLLILFFFVISTLLTPMMQEYFDPYMIIVALLCFKCEFNIDFKNTIFLIFYNSTLLFSANIYYQ